VFIANVNDLRNILENIGQLVESLHNAMDVNKSKKLGLMKLMLNQFIDEGSTIK
jgi:hypothetical protein